MTLGGRTTSHQRWNSVVYVNVEIYNVQQRWNKVVYFNIEVNNELNWTIELNWTLKTLEIPDKMKLCPLQREAPFHEMIPRQITTNNNLKSRSSPWKISVKKFIFRKFAGLQAYSRQLY